MCTFANQIKTINLFEYKKNASKYSLFELAHQTIVRTCILMHTRATS